MNVKLRTVGCRASRYDSVRARADGHERQALGVVGDARAAARARARAEGEADVVVIGSGRARAGLAGDYLTVTRPDPLPRRPDRLRARLEGDGAPLRAHPIDTAIS